MDRNQKKSIAQKAFDAVALRKESVDRNIRQHTLFFARVGRSPQGERG